MMAWLSAIGPRPGTISTGILPFGLIARYSGVRVAPATMFICLSSYGMPSAFITRRHL